MNRQARGGGPVAIGASSGTRQAQPRRAARTGEGTIGGAQPQGPRLERRLGRSDLSAVPEARHAVRELLRQWGKPGRSEIAELLTSELVTNALVHTDHDAVLTATVEPYRVRVEVRDFVGRVPRPREAQREDGDGTHGRGLVLVQSLADAWGVRSHAVGKAVWFELGAEAA